MTPTPAGLYSAAITNTYLTLLVWRRSSRSARSNGAGRAKHLPARAASARNSLVRRHHSSADGIVDDGVDARGIDIGVTTRRREGGRKTAWRDMVAIWRQSGDAIFAPSAYHDEEGAAARQRTSSTSRRKRRRLRRRNIIKQNAGVGGRTNSRHEICLSPRKLIGFISSYLFSVISPATSTT